ncbi:hypothetical protein CW751_13015 [Brumimicrobium salinarum]|uniref:Uncharacterized protein n=2 Tax=Brumimicrobium salinarum TaxID=2058658 RepID=A0A2I0QZX7_9FLAO|nr:hypothetical protein CW751_13015 [Brumimicrobium salinarum]
MLLSIAWISYSSYELWINNDNTVSPHYVFCEEDGTILLINKFEETKEAQYFDAIKGNPLAGSLNNLDNLNDFGSLKIYVSGQRPIIIFEKYAKWKKKEVKKISDAFKINNLTIHNEGPYLMVSQNLSPCKEKIQTDFLLDADKKASANLWVKKDSIWKRTDVYNLNKGLFEYRSSAPKTTFGNPVKDIPIFSSVIPNSITTYNFRERFYAAQQDSIFKNGAMSEWVDKGFVAIDFEGNHILVSDYRSQQKPSLILIEKSKNEDSVQVFDDMHSFTGFQLTHDFPSKHKGRFYVLEIEEKVVLVESKKIARKFIVNYQLANTLALSPERKDQFFGGLPSHVNLRKISKDQKSSSTWKNQLLFEVNTMPPNEQFMSEDKTTWSASVQHQTNRLIPITDHLRQGISVLNVSSNGAYELLGPNGNSIWHGKTEGPVIGKIKVIDVFDNNKHQFLFRTKKRIYLIDLNGNDVGGFPYVSNTDFTSEISQFIWNGTKRFLIGNEKGEITMINSAGQELNIVQVGTKSIIATPYALNIKGNLRAWAANEEQQQFLAYLETPAKAEMVNKTSTDYLVKHNGSVQTYFAKEDNIYKQILESNGKSFKDAVLIDQGSIVEMNDKHITIADQNKFKVYNHNNNITYSIQLPFNEVGVFNYHDKVKTSVVLDYLKNKIHAYDNLGNSIKGFPKEGRNTVISSYDAQSKTLYIYTVISKSIICYKIKIEG